MIPEVFENRHDYLPLLIELGIRPTWRERSSGNLVFSSDWGANDFYIGYPSGDQSLEVSLEEVLAPMVGIRVHGDWMVVPLDPDRRVAVFNLPEGAFSVGRYHIVQLMGFRSQDGLEIPNGCSVDISFMAPVAGDVNVDGRFDQFDIIQMLLADRYLSGLPATWVEGDGDGDGLFTQHDIILALVEDRYLEGIYATAPVTFEISSVRAEGDRLLFFSIDPAWLKSRLETTLKSRALGALKIRAADGADWFVLPYQAADVDAHLGLDGSAVSLSVTHPLEDSGSTSMEIYRDNSSVPGFLGDLSQDGLPFADTAESLGPTGLADVKGIARENTCALGGGLECLDCRKYQIVDEQSAYHPIRFNMRSYFLELGGTIEADYTMTIDIPQTPFSMPGCIGSNCGYHIVHIFQADDPAHNLTNQVLVLDLDTMDYYRSQGPGGLHRHCPGFRYQGSGPPGEFSRYCDVIELDVTIKAPDHDLENSFKLQIAKADYSRVQIENPVLVQEDGKTKILFDLGIYDWTPLWVDVRCNHWYVDSYPGHVPCGEHPYAPGCPERATWDYIHIPLDVGNECTFRLDQDWAGFDLIPEDEADFDASTGYYGTSRAGEPQPWLELSGACRRGDLPGGKVMLELLAVGDGTWMDVELVEVPQSVIPVCN